MGGRGKAEASSEAKAAVQQPEKRPTNRLEAMRHPLRARILRLLVERGVMSPAQLSRTLRAELGDEDLDPISADDLVINSFQRVIDDFVASRKAKMVGFDRHFYLARTPYVMDEQGFQKGMEAVDRCRLELSEIELRSAERREAGVPGVAVSGSLLWFKVPNASLDT